MSMLDGTETDSTKKFNKLFCELEHCNEDEQRKKILEMNEVVDGMNEEEIESIFTEELFNKIHQMIEEKKMSMENTILLLKHVGYCDALKNVWNLFFKKSLLSRRFEKMIIDEEEKKKEKNVKLLTDLCECYLLLSNQFDSEMLSICVPCLLKAASKKEKSEEVQKEVEVALLALNKIPVYDKVPKELYYNEIKEIIQYHQEYQNLTRLAYQSAWQFLIRRILFDRSLEEIIVNELHFVREAIKELEELTNSVDWKREKEEKGVKEKKEELTLMRWFLALAFFFESGELWNEELSGLFRSIIQIFRAAKDHHKEISYWCVYIFEAVIGKRASEIEVFLKGGAVDLVLEETIQSTLNDVMIFESLRFFITILKRLKGEKNGEIEKEKRKETKRKVFEKLEEEGYEDCIILLQYYVFKGVDYCYLSIKSIEELFIYL